MKRLFFSIVILLFSFILSCAPIMTDQEFQQTLDNSHAGVHPLFKPKYGNLIVAIPSLDTIEKEYVYPKLQAKGAAKYFDQEQITRVSIKVSKINDLIVQSIKKKNLFTEVSSVIVSEPISAKIEQYNFLLYRDVDGWFLTKKEIMIPQKINISYMDPSSKLLNILKVPNISLFLDALDNLANEFQSKEKQNI